MSDSEDESRTATVGRKRIRTGKSGNHAIAAPSSSRASSAQSATSSKESGEISSSNGSSRHSSRQSQRHPTVSEDDQGDDSDSGSSETDTSSGTDDSDEEPPAHSMASPEGEVDPPFTGRANKPKGHEDEELRLSDLTEKEEKDQLFYFHYTSRSDKDFIVRCFCCGAKGHMHHDCPERECKQCGALDKHASHACPQGRKCGRCRQRGHDSRDCTNPTKGPSTIESACDICGKTGHVEEECMQMWCTGPEPMTMRPVRRIWKVCYNCGAQGYDRKGHWGDDCPDLDYYGIDSLGRQIKTWSADHANQFIDPEVEDSESEDEKNQSLSPSNDASSNDGPSNDSQYDPMEDLEDFANDRPSKKRSKERASESEDEGQVQESTSPPTRSTWQMALLDDARD